MSSNALVERQPIPFQQQVALADAFVKSGLFGMKDASQALSLMALCEAEGLHPAKAVQEYHIIQGKAARKADAVLARFQAAGGSVKWTVYTDTEVTGTFAHPQGGSVEVKWTIADAKRIGLAGKDNWKNYPRAMLRARCISEGVRTVFPGATVGTYTVEEMMDMDDTIDVTATQHPEIKMPQPKPAPKAQSAAVPPPAAQTAPEAPAAAPSGPLNSGKMKYLENKAKSLGVDLPATALSIGFDLSTLDDAGFDKVKAALLDIEASGK